MHEMIRKRNELLAQKVIKGLESRNMKAYYAATKGEALQKALELIPESAEVKDTIKQIEEAKKAAAAAPKTSAKDGK